MPRKTKLDQLDYDIFRILQENGRITNLDLSKTIDLSPAPTLERVKKLEKQGYIKSYHAQINQKALGIGIEALIQISLERQLINPMHNFAEQISGIDEIVECYQVTGNYDYMLKVMVEDVDALNALISEKLSKIEEIGQFKSSIIIAKLKDSKVVPLKYER